MAENGAVAGCRNFAAEIRSKLVQGSTGFAQFKVQGSRFKVRATQGSMTKFSDLKVQSDQRVDDKFQVHMKSCPEPRVKSLYVSFKN